MIDFEDNEILCILIQNVSGELVWVPKMDYERNPDPQTFVVLEKPPRYDPVIREGILISRLLTLSR